jgi:citrate lyase subunit beta/citryl-CoA lyase
MTDERQHDRAAYREGWNERPASTYLFVPANEVRKVASAFQSGSDAVILDLEDSVPEANKDAARRVIPDLVRTYRIGEQPRVWIRVNADKANLMADVRAIDWSLVEGAIVPKAENADLLSYVEAAGAKRLIPLVETVTGFSALSALAGIRGVSQFAIGTFDLALDLGLLAVSDPDEAELMWQLRGTLTIESRRLGLAAPIDGVYARLDDDDGLRSVSRRAVRLGYGGKLIVHPRQIPIVRSVFEPSREELQFARDVLTMSDRAELAGRGAIQFGGRMIDRPAISRARALLARWDTRT